MKKVLLISVLAMFLVASVAFALSPEDYCFDVEVLQIDDNTGDVLSFRYQTVYYGTNVIYAGKAPAGYELVSSNECYVTMDEYGNVSDTTVIFEYHNKSIPYDIHRGELDVSSSQTGGSNNSQGGYVSHSGWDTQFRDGMSKNYPDLYLTLPYLYDGNLNTRFAYTIWKSEREDAIPEVTAFFNYATIGSIGIVNGHISTSSLYYQHARARNVTARIYTSNGCYESHFTIPDTYTQNYQWFSLGGSFSNVTQIDLFFEDYYIGQDSTKYEMNITDISFSADS